MSIETGWPTKIIPFAKPEGIVHRVALRDADTFPRFRREWNRPNPPVAPQPGAAPYTPK